MISRLPLTTPLIWKHGYFPCGKRLVFNIRCDRRDLSTYISVSVVISDTGGTQLNAGKSSTKVQLLPLNSCISPLVGLLRNIPVIASPERSSWSNFGHEKIPYFKFPHKHTRRKIREGHRKRCSTPSTDGIGTKDYGASENHED